jgi:adenylate kinase
MNLILLGPPGAGKGTQADKLKAKYGMLHLSTGNAFRAAIAAGTELGKKVEPIMKAGGLVPDDLVIALVDARLAEKDTASGVLFDGYPRTIAQADALETSFQKLGRTIDRVVSIEVPKEVIVERMGGRRFCPKCQTTYHVKAAPPKASGLCDKDGEKLIIRADDEPKTVLARQEKYAKDTAPLLAYYQPKGKLTAVDGTKSPEAVFESIVLALGK